MSDRPAGDFRASAVRHASMGSYSGFVEMPRSEELATLSLSNRAQHVAARPGAARVSRRS